jgi:hypothetical protein
VPIQNQPNIAVLEGLRQVLQKPQHLRRARECWWQSTQSTCLVNQLWDEATQEVVSPQGKGKRKGTQVIQSAVFDALRYRTILQLKGSNPVEIEL